MRARLSVATGLLLAAAAISPATGHADVPPPEELVRSVQRTVQQIVATHPEPPILPPIGPIDPGDPGGPYRLMVANSITITRGPGGAVVVHDFDPLNWTCTQPSDPYANPFTVSCTAVVDQWTCVAMPVAAEATTPNTAVEGTVSCTDSISTGYTAWPSPAVSVSASLGDAPVVTCTATYAAVGDPTQVEKARQVLSRFVDLPRFRFEPGYTVTCGPDPVTP